MVAECILGMASLSAKNPMMRLAQGSDQPEKVCGVKPHAEHTRAIQGEKIWHVEEWQCRTLP